MKTTDSRTVGAVGLVDWLQHPAPRYSLAVGATCGCDLSRLGRDIRDHLNRTDPQQDGAYRSFDAEEIRLIAGDPFWRQTVALNSADLCADLDRRCDYENIIRGVASHGGAILPGQWAIDATRDLPQVYRVALSHCDCCCPDSLLNLDPDGFSRNGLAAVIGKRFRRWCEEMAKAGRAPDPERTSRQALV